MVEFRKENMETNNFYIKGWQKNNNEKYGKMFKYKVSEFHRSIFSTQENNGKDEILRRSYGALNWRLRYLVIRKHWRFNKGTRNGQLKKKNKMFNK